nr:tetratricopeptide repeat protein [Leptospira gomenensis]
MPLPFPEESAEVETFSGRETEEREESGKSATNAATRSSSSSSSRIGAEEKKSSSTLGEGGEARASETISESQGDKNESEKGTKVVAPKGETTSVVSEGNVSQTRLPNSSKTSLKKKKDKKKEDPSESGYKRGVLRLRENQRNNAKSEFDQAGGQGKSSNAARLEGARLTAESSNDANTITEQIDSEEEKWKAVFEVARSLRGNGKTQEAEAQYLRLITEAPENFQTIALVSLGEMLSVTERKDSARRYLLQAIKLIRKKPELDSKGEQQERAVTLIARIYAEQGKYEEAENWAKAYLNRINPNAEENSPFVKELRKIIQKRNY